MNNRSVQARLTKRLPTKMLRLLRQLGKLADEQDVALYLVGGVVRDLLLKRENWDLDLTVEGDGIAFARLVAERYDARLALFERFATARLVMSSGMKVDIASTRRESYAQPAALPDVRPATVKDDLYRRDFTINAMAIRLNAAQFGELYDPYDGQEDLKAKTLRILHQGSFVDDPTRIFRTIRFAQRFGFALDHATRRELTAAAKSNLVGRLSGPRLCNEILLLFSEARPRRSIEWLARMRLLRFLHPSLNYGGVVKRVVEAVPKAVAWGSQHNLSRSIDRPLVYLMAVLDSAGPPVVEDVIARLTLSSDQAKKVRWAGKDLAGTARALCTSSPLRRSDVHHLLIELPDEALMVLLAKALAMKQPDRLGRMKRRLSDFLTTLRGCRPFLRGDDLLRMGFEPGRRIGVLLSRLLDARLNGEVKSESDERALARSLANQPD